MPRPLKADLLHEILTRNEMRSVIAYANTRHVADQLARQLQRRGHTVASLHDSDNQMQRERAVNDLKRGRIHILVTTDVSSRGISMEAIAHVVNFDVPHRPEDYLHRIGRTAQGGAPSDAFSLMSPEEQPAVTLIERFLGRTVPRVLLPDFDYKMRPTEIKQAVSYPSRDRLATTVTPVKVPIKPAPAPNSKGAAKPGRASGVRTDHDALAHPDEPAGGALEPDIASEPVQEAPGARQALESVAGLVPVSSSSRARLQVHAVRAASASAAAACTRSGLPPPRPRERLEQPRNERLEID